MIDAAGLILEFNREAERTFGFIREDVLGRELAETIVPRRGPGRAPSRPAALRRLPQRTCRRAAHRDERVAPRRLGVPGRDDRLRSQLSQSERRSDRVSRLPARHLGTQAGRACAHRDAGAQPGDSPCGVARISDAIAAPGARRVDELAGRELLAAGRGRSAEADGQLGRRRSSGGAVPSAGRRAATARRRRAARARAGPARTDLARGLPCRRSPSTGAGGASGRPACSGRRARAASARHGRGLRVLHLRAAGA